MPLNNMKYLQIYMRITAILYLISSCTNGNKISKQEIPLTAIPLKAQTFPNYWEDPSVFEFGREPARADFKVFESEPKALGNLYSSSQYYSNLNGFWKYQFFNGPDYVPAHIEDSLSSLNWLDISMPGFAELKNLCKPIFKYDDLPFNLDYPKVPHDSNAVFVLKKSFELSPNWSDRDVFAVFEGISTSYFVYLNGGLVGYNEDTKAASEYLLNKYLKPGRNEITLILIRYSDGSYFETHDGWSLTGINRASYLLARPKIRINDFFAKTNLNGTKGVLDVETKIANKSTLSSDVIIEAKILDEKTRFVLTSTQIKSHINQNSMAFNKLHLGLNDANVWSDEIPNTYDILINIKSATGELLESAYSKIAFNSISYKKRLLVNNKDVKIKGVAAHEFHPINGNILDKEWIDNDMDVMKLHNINSIRNSHYPFESYWYQSALKFGLYMMDECNLDLSALLKRGMDLSKDSTATKIFLSRVANTFERNKNYANIFCWSVGFQTGLGPNIQKCIEYIKSRDDKRAVTAVSENKSLGDFDLYGEKSSSTCNLLYSLGNCQGNSAGGLYERWNEQLTNNNFAGGFIEDFTDQCFYMKNVQGQLFFGYGGVFGETLSDSFLCARGIFTSNKTANPPSKIVSHIFSKFKTRCLDIQKGSFSISNLYKFYQGDNFNFFWTIDVNGEKIKEGKFENFQLKAGETKNVAIDISGISKEPGKEYCYTIIIEKVVNNKGMFRFLTESIEKFCIPTISGPMVELDSIKGFTVNESSDQIEIKNELNSFILNKKNASIESWKINGFENLESPIIPIFYRAPTDQDILQKRIQTNRIWKELWNNKKIVDQKIVEKSRTKIVFIQNLTFSSIPGIVLHTEYSFYNSGDLKLNMEMSSTNNDNFLPARTAWTFEIKSILGTASWYGRGPYETYPDRKEGLQVGLYKSTVTDFNIPRIRPQEMSNKTDTRWLDVSSFHNNHLCMVGLPVMDIKILPFSYEELEGRHLYGIDLKPGKNNAIIVGKEIWPMDDSPLSDQKWPMAQKLKVQIRLTAYKADQNQASHIWSSTLP